MRETQSQPLFLLMPTLVFFGGIGFAIAEMLGKSDILSDTNGIKLMLIDDTRLYPVIVRL